MIEIETEILKFTTHAIFGMNRFIEYKCDLISDATHSYIKNANFASYLYWSKLVFDNRNLQKKILMYSPVFAHSLARNPNVLLHTYIRTCILLVVCIYFLYIDITATTDLNHVDQRFPVKIRDFANIKISKTASQKHSHKLTI